MTGAAGLQNKTGQESRKSGRPSAVVADDDPGVLLLVSRLLQSSGFTVSTCQTGVEAMELFQSLHPSLVLLDVKLPDADGVELVRTMRKESDVPVIVITTVADDGDVARILEIGADDFVRKPFRSDELMARVRAVMRRARLEMHRPGKFICGSLVVSEREHLVTLHDREVPLSKTEFRLLVYLMRNHDRLLTHDQILTNVWGASFAGSHHILSVAVSRLRSKLGGKKGFGVASVRGVGYRIVLPHRVTST